MDFNVVPDSIYSWKYLKYPRFLILLILDKLGVKDLLQSLHKYLLVPEAFLPHEIVFIEKQKMHL
jgi:hypothetical protein